MKSNNGSASVIATEAAGSQELYTSDLAGFQPIDISKGRENVRNTVRNLTKEVLGQNTKFKVPVLKIFPSSHQTLPFDNESQNYVDQTIVEIEANNQNDVGDDQFDGVRFINKIAVKIALNDKKGDIRTTGLAMHIKY